MAGAMSRRRSCDGRRSEWTAGEKNPRSLVLCLLGRQVQTALAANVTLALCHLVRRAASGVMEARPPLPARVRGLECGFRILRHKHRWGRGVEG